jgi:hypothetical protein
LARYQSVISVEIRRPRGFNGAGTGMALTCRRSHAFCGERKSSFLEGHYLIIFFQDIDYVLFHNLPRIVVDQANSPNCGFRQGGDFLSWNVVTAQPIGNAQIVQEAFNSFD